MNDPKKKRKMNEELINDRATGNSTVYDLTSVDDMLLSKLKDQFRFKDTIINGAAYSKYHRAMLIELINKSLRIFKNYLFEAIGVESTYFFKLTENDDDNEVLKKEDNYIKFIKGNSNVYPKTSKIDFKKVREMLYSTKKSQKSIKKIAIELNYPYFTLLRAVKKIMKFRFIKCNRLNKNSNSLKNDYQVIYFTNTFSNVIEKKNYFIFIDESSFNSNKRSTKQWISNKKTNIIYDSGRISGLNLILACTGQKIFHFNISNKKLNTDNFCNFINELLMKIMESYELREMYINNNIYLIYDNCPIHKSKKTKEYLKNTKFNILTLPTYSPYFNICEFVFSNLKRSFYKKVYSSK